MEQTSRENGGKYGVCKEIPEHLKELWHRSCTHLVVRQCLQLANLLTVFQNVFSRYDGDLGRTHLMEHTIDLVPGNTPIKLPLCKVPMGIWSQARKAIQELIDADLIEPSSAPFCALIVWVRKPSGKLRVINDYRRLNEATISDTYTLPRIDDSLDQLSNCKWFNSIDLASGLFQVPLKKEDCHKSAFGTDQSNLWKVIY